MAKKITLSSTAIRSKISTKQISWTFTIKEKNQQIKQISARCENKTSAFGAKCQGFTFQMLSKYNLSATICCITACNQKITTS